MFVPYCVGMFIILCHSALSYHITSCHFIACYIGIVHVCMHIYISLSIYIYIYMYLYTYMHTHTHTGAYRALNKLAFNTSSFGVKLRICYIISARLSLSLHSMDTCCISSSFQTVPWTSRLQYVLLPGLLYDPSVNSQFCVSASLLR